MNKEVHESLQFLEDEFYQGFDIYSRDLKVEDLSGINWGEYEPAPLYASVCVLSPITTLEMQGIPRESLEQMILLDGLWRIRIMLVNTDSSYRIAQSINESVTQAIRVGMFEKLEYVETQDPIYGGVSLPAAQYFDANRNLTQNPVSEQETIDVLSRIYESGVRPLTGDGLFKYSGNLSIILNTLLKQD